LIQTAVAWPTILTAEQEFALLEALRSIGDEALLSQFGDFSLLLARLDDSHAGGGIFEVTDLNRDAFDAGANWIESLARAPLPDRDQGFIRSVAETLRTRFPRH
jgi:hypothetical protein